MAEVLTPMQVYPGKLGIRKNPNLDAAGARFEQRMADRVEGNPERYVDRYIKANRSRGTGRDSSAGMAGGGKGLAGGPGGLIVDVDRARKLFPEYDLSKKTRAKYSEPIHEIASAIAKAAFAKWVAEPGDKPVAFVLGAGGSGKTFVIDKELMKELHALYDTQMARLGSSTSKIDAALNAGRNVLLFYIDRPPELAMSGIIDRSVETGRTIPIPVIAQNHASAQRTFVRLYEKYQDDPRVRFYVVDNPGGSEDVRSISIEELRARPQPQAGELEPRLRKVLDNERIRRTGTATAITDGIYNALSGNTDTGNGRAGRAEPGSGSGHLGQTGGWPGEPDDSESEDERAQAGAQQAGRGEGYGSASASAWDLPQQSAGADAEDAIEAGGGVQGSNLSNRGSQFGSGGDGRAFAAQSGYADPTGGASDSVAPGAGGEDGTAGVGEGGSARQGEWETRRRGDAGTRRRGDAGTRGRGEEGQRDLETPRRGYAERERRGEIEDEFDRYLNTDQAVKDYKRHFGKVISVDQAKELSPDYAESNSSRASLAGAVQEPAHKFAHSLYTRELAKHALPGQQNMVLFTAGGTGSGKTSTIRNADQTKLHRDAQIVFDGTLHDYDDGTKLIDQALEAGKRVVVVAVHRPTEDAFERGVITRGMRQGRPVPIDEHVGSHAGIRSAWPRYVERYRDNPKVQFVRVDNSRGAGRAEWEVLGKTAKPQRTPTAE